MAYQSTGKPRGRPRKDAPTVATKDDVMTDELATDVPETNIPLTETAEFKAALAAAKEAMRADLMGEVVAAVAKSKGPDGDIKELVSQLVMGIATMTDSGDNRKKIAPAEIERRIAAHGRMVEVVERIQRTPNLKPHYAVVAEMQLEEQLIQKYVAAGEGKWKQAEIIWRGIPNSAMRPLNDIAKEIYGHYLESIGGTTANTAGIREQPTWVSYGGLQVVGSPPQSLAHHGLATEPATPMELGASVSDMTSEITSVDDPMATKIPILGKTFAPAERTAPGDFGKLQFPAH